MRILAEPAQEQRPEGQRAQAEQPKEARAPEEPGPEEQAQEEQMRAQSIPSGAANWIGLPAVLVRDLQAAPITPKRLRAQQEPSAL